MTSWWRISILENQDQTVESAIIIIVAKINLNTYFISLKYHGYPMTTYSTSLSLNIYQPLCRNITDT